MRLVRSFLLVIVLVSSFVVMAATEALACSCVPPRPDDKAVKDATAVFSGTLIEADVAEPGFSPGVWTFSVDTVYKGDVSQLQVVHSHTQSSACGLLFDEAKRYAVFAYDPPQGDKLQTNSCMNTRPLDEGENLRLEPVRDFAGGIDLVPVEDGHIEVPVWVLALGVGAVTVLIAGGLAYYSRKRG